MPRAPKKCGHPGCDELVRGRTYCPEHDLAWVTPSGRGRETRSWAWEKLRLDVLERDGYVCYLCGGPGADSVDHIVPKSAGGSDELDNLAAVHDRNPPHCHRSKTRHDRSML